MSGGGCLLVSTAGRQASWVASRWPGQALAPGPSSHSQQLPRSECLRGHTTMRPPFKVTNNFTNLGFTNGNLNPRWDFSGRTSWSELPRGKSSSHSPCWSRWSRWSPWGAGGRTPGPKAAHARAGHGRQPGAERRARPVHDPSGQGMGRPGVCGGGRCGKASCGSHEGPSGRHATAIEVSP